MGTALQRNSTGALEKARYSDGSVHKYSHFVPQREEGNFCVKMSNKNEEINPVAPELLFFLISAHPVYTMWIIQEPNKLALWNKLHFEEKKNGEYRACLKYSVPIFVE